MSLRPSDSVGFVVVARRFGAVHVRFIPRCYNALEQLLGELVPPRLGKATVVGVDVNGLAVDSSAADAVGPDAHSYSDDLAEELEEARDAEPHYRIAADLPVDRFLDREASWLSFNSRVLDLAREDSTPLLERIRYLAIFASNLDEFFMVRVAGLRRRIATGIAGQRGGSTSARGRLDAIEEAARVEMSSHAQAFADLVKPLHDAGIVLLPWSELTEDELAKLATYFAEQIYPILTPLAVDPAHPFPHISGLSLNLAVILRDHTDGSEHFARVKVPPALPRLVPVGTTRFVLVEDVIAAHLGQLFAGMAIVETHTFRVTRNEDLDIDQEDVEDLLQALERELSRRRFGPPVRLEIQPGMSSRVLNLLLRELGMAERDVYRLPGPLDLTAMSALADLDLPALKYPPFVPATPPRLRDPRGDHQSIDMFRVVRERDLLVQHPYESFATTTEAFIERAAADPAVVAIKMTLYRTSGESAVVESLVDAARSGKQVLVLVEIKARFDEQANIGWARALEQAGCHVVYGLVGLKTHCKLCLVIRREESGQLRRYVHIGTGNYNPKTARIYEDLGLLTADPDVGGDVTDLFNHLSGHTKSHGYRRLLVAPDSIRDGLRQRIEREASNARRGQQAGIAMKVNNLVDEDIIDALYRASRADVPIDLLVRGMCSLRPNVPGLSESIRVRSILGRFLEHSRIFQFHNAGQEEVWLGSADVMQRNLDRRVEALVSVTEPNARDRLRSLLELAMQDNVGSWRLTADGSWSRHSGEGTIDYQGELIARLDAPPS